MSLISIPSKKEDDVVLIGSKKDLTVSVASFSDLSNQLNYELLTRIAKRFLARSSDNGFYKII
jgi:alanine racemase